jgi:MoaA/NifB/PqqE/SkfB family radical SAM enzyme
MTKTFRKDIPPHRVCITWLINNKCNYRCSYCQNDFKEPAGFKVLSPQEWFNVWEAIYDKYGTVAVQVTGGEPAAYPRIFETLNKISKMHHIEMQTNLSWEPQELIENVQPQRISRIGASFHREFVNFEKFLEKMLKLKSAGYKVEITFVAYPPFLEEGKNYLKMSTQVGVPFSVLSFQGEYRGRRYPESYDKGEIKLLKDLNLSVGDYAKAMADWDIEHKVVVDKIEESQDISRICRMGQMYAWVLPNGNALRCCKSPVSLGNIIDGTFALLEDARPCRLKDCICWRSMVLGEEERWKERWPGTKEKAQD